MTKATTIGAAVDPNPRSSREEGPLKVIEELNRDISHILGGTRPRGYGQCPKALGDYQMIAPHSENYTAAVKLKKRYVRGL